MSPVSLIRGQHVYLRHPTRADVHEFQELRRVSRALHQPWEPAPDDSMDPYGEEAFLNFLASANTATFQKHLVCRASDDVLVGYVGLGQIFMGPFCSGYLGYWTGAPYTGRGYATEAVALTLERAFTQLGLHRVEANVMPENGPSLAIVRRCGFREEGYSPRYLCIAGQWRDHTRWAITIEDWQQHDRGSDDQQPPG